MALATLKQNNPITRLKLRILAIKVDETLFEVLEDNKELIEDLNAEQLNQGIRSDGSTIQPPYSPSYAKFKRALGFNPKIVNLKLSGDYHDDITAKVEKLAFTLDNVNEKDAMLSEKYGALIIGLTEESVAKLIEFILPEFRTLLLHKMLTG